MKWFLHLFSYSISGKVKEKTGQRVEGVMRPALIACAVAFCLSTVSVNAQPHTSTKYQYYSVSGNTALEVYRSMLARGPRVNGAKAYASTSAQSSQAGYLVQGQSCRVKNYSFRIDFMVKLPKMMNERRLPPLVRAKWTEFSDFVKKHEDTHRAIWMGCAKEFESRVAAITREIATGSMRGRLSSGAKSGRSATSSIRPSMQRSRSCS